MFLQFYCKNTICKNICNTNTRTNKTVVKNNLSKLLQTNNKKIALYDRPGIYKLTCSTCKNFYIGQTGRSFNIRYKENKPENNIIECKSKYAAHIINESHTHINLETNLDIIHLCNKGRIMDVYEELEIYRATKTDNNKLLNDKLIYKHNCLFEIYLNS